MRAINWIALLAAVLATSMYSADADTPVKASAAVDLQQVKDNTKEETTIVQNLEKEIQTLTATVEMFNKDVIKEKKVFEKAKIELKMVTAELNEARKRLGAHEGMSLN
uniref:RxLR effector candidate protein n=1 Tax=Hyaloperonospora arabidopsidis (strain Emoy2) TaxID=559515 RepID=M4BZG4_HYAAE